MTGFVHLRLHSEYSLIDGLVRMKPLVKSVADMNMPAVALTDQTNFYALIKFYKKEDETGLKAYSETALKRIWKAMRFSWWMTTMLHKFPENEGFGDRIQQTEIEYLFSSKAAQTALAENYVGLPY